MTIQLNASTLFRTLLIVVAALTVINGALTTIEMTTGRDWLYGLRPLFNVDLESNIPSLFSVLQLGIAALLLWALAIVARSQSDGWSRYWTGLSLIFAFLMLDEGCSIHDLLTEPMRRLLNSSGALYFAWVVPYAVFVAVFCVAYFRFWLALPSRPRVLFAVAGVVYVSGALGMELVESSMSRTIGTHGWRYGLATGIEECLEMLGISLLIFALTELLAVRVGEFRIICHTAPQRTRHAADPLPILARGQADLADCSVAPATIRSETL